MHIRSILLFCFVILFTLPLQAQDKLFLKNRPGPQLVHVLEVSDQQVKYKKADNPDGPVYSTPWAQVEKIQYANGTTEQLRMAQQHSKQGHNKGTMKRNIVSLAPLQVTDHGVGLGLAYERILGRNGIFALQLPVAFTYYQSNENYNSIGVVNNDPTYMFQCYPGIKIYPNGTGGKVRYGIGPSLAIASGTRYSDVQVYDPATGATYRNTAPAYHFMMGMLINNSVNFFPSDWMYLSVELGLGVSYFDQADVEQKNFSPIMQLAFRMGYRF